MTRPTTARAKRVCIVLHDVASTTWDDCARVLDMLDALGAAPVTLLVVPDYHGRGRASESSAFVRAVGARFARGDEVALHGYAHRDDAPRARGIAERFRRRVMTAGEGEFAALDRPEAASRIALGLAELARAGWRADGFVPPAWLASAGTRDALRAPPLRYTSTHAALIALPDGRRIVAPCLTASTRTRARRLASRLWLRAMRLATVGLPLVRVGLHPSDARHADVMATWREVIGALLAAREPILKSRAIDEAACAAPASC
jgi:predicted deacetylase